MKIINRVLLILALLAIPFCIWCYKKQRETYEGFLTLRLQSACSSLIHNDFGRHASLFDISKEEHYSYGVTSKFTIFNDLVSLEIYGRSTIYFSDYTPQVITCRAYIPHKSSGYKNLSKNTIVELYINGINYFPENHTGILNNKNTFNFSMKEIESFSPFTSIIPLNKPKFLR